jgi:ribosome-associated protein
MRISRTLSINDGAIKERFVHASGPGGQNVNKVATAVELRFDLERSGLSEEIRARAARLAGHRLNLRGIIVIQAHELRTQLGNRKAARARLLSILRSAAKAPRVRKPTKPAAVVAERRLQQKHRRAVVKRRRSRRVDDE